MFLILTPASFYFGAFTIILIDKCISSVIFAKTIQPQNWMYDVRISSRKSISLDKMEYLVYWMQQVQRVESSHALAKALLEANEPETAFGLMLYLNAKRLKRKFDMPDYLEKVRGL